MKQTYTYTFVKRRSGQQGCTNSHNGYHYIPSHDQQIINGQVLFPKKTQSKTNSYLKGDMRRHDPLFQ